MPLNKTIILFIDICKIIQHHNIYCDLKYTKDRVTHNFSYLKYIRPLKILLTVCIRNTKT
jgi:hypothetical protein